MSNKKPAAKKTEAVNPTAPEEVTVPPVEAAEPVSVKAPNEPMQTAGGNEKVDPRPLAVIASNMTTVLVFLPI